MNSQDDMNTEDFLAWGEKYHYPQLVLRADPRSVLRHGKQPGHALVEHDDLERLQLAMACVKRWKERMQDTTALTMK